MLYISYTTTTPCIWCNLNTQHDNPMCPLYTIQILIHLLILTWIISNEWKWMHKQHLLMGMFAFLSSVMCILKYRPECTVEYVFSSTNPTIYVSSNVSFWRCSYCLSNSTGGCSNHMCRAQNDYGKEIKLLLKVETKQWKNHKFCPRFWLNVGMIEGRGGWGGGLKNTLYIFVNDTICIIAWCIHMFTHCRRWDSWRSDFVTKTKKTLSWAIGNLPPWWSTGALIRCCSLFYMICGNMFELWFLWFLWNDVLSLYQCIIIAFIEMFTENAWLLLTRIFFL